MNAGRVQAVQIVIQIDFHLDLVLSDETCERYLPYMGIARGIPSSQSERSHWLGACSRLWPTRRPLPLLSASSESPLRRHVRCARPLKTSSPPPAMSRCADSRYLRPAPFRRSLRRPYLSRPPSVLALLTVRIQMYSSTVTLLTTTPRSVLSLVATCLVTLTKSRLPSSSLPRT